MSLQTVLNFAFSANLQGTAAVGGGAPAFNMNFQPLVGGTLPTGTGSAKADQLWTKQYIVAAGATAGGAAIDLTSLGNDNIGVALAPVNVKVLAIVMKGNLGCTYVAAVAIHAGGGGSGYSSSGTLTVGGGTGTASTISFTASGGVLQTVTVLTPGSYTANPTTSNNAATGGGGSGAGLDLTMSTVVEGSQVYVEADYLSVGGDGTSNAWVSVLADKSDIIKLYSGNATLPGFMIFGNASNAGYAIGSTNKLLKIVNSGSNPVTFNIIGIGATA